MTLTNQKIYHIVAADLNNGIGKDGKMPWDFSTEVKFFKKMTTKTKDHDKKNMVVMGRTTWESIPEKFRPLKNRKNVVLTRNKDYLAEGATICNSIDEAFDQADENIETIFIIGGARVYEETISHPKLTGVYLTRIEKEYDCDTYFPQIPEDFSKVESLGKDEEGGVEFEYLLLEKE